MAASAVIRVKRSRDEQPLEALLVSSKRRKFDESTEETPVTTVLTFAGTVKTQDESVRTQISKALKKTKKEPYKSHVPKIAEKNRETLKSKWQEERFKVVNLYRSQGEEGAEVSGSDAEIEELTVLDIEAQPAEDQAGCSGSVAGSEDYEYDLYYTESAVDLCSGGVLDVLLSVRPFDLVNEAALQDEDEEVGWEQSDNEDDEGNWRNDYPDERSSDEEEGREGRRCGRIASDSDDELLFRMANCELAGNELSDDEGEEDLVYGREESPFAEYRRRNTRELHSSTSDLAGEGLSELSGPSDDED